MFGKFGPPFSRVIAAGFLTALFALGVAGAWPPSSPDVQITIEQLSDAEVRVTYELKRRRRELILGDVPGGYRERRWEVETSGFELQRYETEDRIIQTNGARFDRVVVTAKPDLIRLPKEYQPITRYGDGGAMIYTGHFWPMTGRGGRMNATFTFLPTRSADVVAFGRRAPALRDWRSPMAHPAFVYLGPIKPVETRDVMALVDPDAPPWIIAEFYGVTPRAFEWLADEFGFSPETKPNLFLAAPLGNDEGRLSYAGDALPAQFQITLEGAAWLNPTDQAKDLFRRSTIHEAVHLWQSAARPSVDEVAAWIHEGAADAMAADALLALGYWDDDDVVADFQRARRECADELDHGSLATAQERGRYRAIYACGHVIAVAVAHAEDASVADFWRAFIAQAKEQDGYTERLFYSLVRERTGDEEFAEAVRYFVRMPLAKPERDIERLMASAGAPLASPAGR